MPLRTELTTLALLAESAPLRWVEQEVARHGDGDEHQKDQPQRDRGQPHEEQGRGRPADDVLAAVRHVRLRMVTGRMALIAILTPETGPVLIPAGERSLTYP